MKPRIRQQARFSILYIAVAVVVLVFLQSWLLTPQAQEIPMSRLVEWVREDRVARVSFGEREIRGVLKEPISSLFQSLSDAGLSPVAALRITNSLFLAGTLLAVAAISWGGIFGMRIVDGKRSALELARKFAHAFIPIALAYLVAHYFSLVVYQEQAQFTYLLSDPLGDGSDLFGTAGSGIDYSLVGATAIWYVQFGAIVVGHVIALALGHDRALALWKDSRTAAYSQVWMLVTMVFFSVLGLYLLSQANG